MNTERTWKTRYSGAEYGPYTDAEMLAYIQQHRINGETEVQHPRFTQGYWRLASDVPALRDRLNSPTVAPAKSHPPPDVSPSMVELAQSMKSQPRRRLHRKSSLAKLPAAIAIIALCVAAGSAFLWIPGKSIGLLGPSESPEQRLIRAYLRQETPTGKWEEIGWSQDVVYSRPVTRLDFRTENIFGGQTKEFICAKFYQDSDTAFMAGWGIDFELWADPTKYGLPAANKPTSLAGGRRQLPKH